MKRSLMIVAMLGLLVLPGVAGAEEETMVPPELNWSPTPEYQGTSTQVVDKVGKNVFAELRQAISDMVQQSPTASLALEFPVGAYLDGDE
jgi:hypothetical protein